MAKKTAPLSGKAIDRELKTLAGWKLNAKRTEISKTFLFKNFKEALRFTNKVGKLAEAAQHHPDVALSYGKVKVRLSTHDAGGLTRKDFDLAGEIGGQM